VLIDLIEELNLRNPLYVEFFEIYKKVEDNSIFGQQNQDLQDRSPLWLFEILTDHLNFDKKLVIEEYMHIMDRSFLDDD